MGTGQVGLATAYAGFVLGRRSERRPRGSAITYQMWTHTIDSHTHRGGRHTRDSDRCREMDSPRVRWVRYASLCAPDNMFFPGFS